MVESRNNKADHAELIPLPKKEKNKKEAEPAKETAEIA